MIGMEPISGVTNASGEFTNVKTSRALTAERGYAVQSKVAGRLTSVLSASAAKNSISLRLCRLMWGRACPFDIG